MFLHKNALAQKRSEYRPLGWKNFGECSIRLRRGSQNLGSFLLTPNTKIIYAESPTNPGVQILDLEMLGQIAKKHNLLLVIDNCFATPYIQQPIKFGADLVIHSATKLIDGQGRVLGGAVVGRKELIREVYLFARNTGPSISPFNAWILSKSLETLAVRIERHCETAMKIATDLENHPKVNCLKYPFLKSHPKCALAKKQMKLGGNIIAFEIEGGLDAGRNFLNSIKCVLLPQTSAIVEL
ncbi:MAG: O-succinylhomoserine sulfhydrylase [Halioglobus sp.]|jgi:O-succinylhomoserine sulfhydrylase